MYNRRRSRFQLGISGSQNRQKYPIFSLKNGYFLVIFGQNSPCTLKILETLTGVGRVHAKLSQLFGPEIGFWPKFIVGLSGFRFFEIKNFVIFCQKNVNFFQNLGKILAKISSTDTITGFFEISKFQ